VASSRDRQRKLERARQERRLVRRAEKLRRRRQIQAGVGAVVALLVVVLGTVWLTGGFSGKKAQNASNVAAGSCTWNTRAPTRRPASATRATRRPPASPTRASGR